MLQHTESDIRNIHLKLESVEEDENIYEQMFTAVVMASDETHLLSEMFKILPSRSVCNYLFHEITGSINNNGWPCG